MAPHFQRVIKRVFSLCLFAILFVSPEVLALLPIPKNRWFKSIPPASSRCGTRRGGLIPCTGDRVPVSHQGQADRDQRPRGELGATDFDQAIQDDPRPRRQNSLFIAHDCDIALLELMMTGSSTAWNR
jgi:hypothetical protein